MQIAWQVRNIAKHQIFHKVKFITCNEQLDRYKEGNSIGYYFFKCYTEHVVNVFIIGNRGDFWNNVKQSIYEAINEKRNAVQTAIKKKWIGKMKSMNMIMIILYVKYFFPIFILCLRKQVCT